MEENKHRCYIRMSIPYPSRVIGKGRPPKKTTRQKRKEWAEYTEYNAIEGRIGNSKQAYSLNQGQAAPVLRNLD